jgi:hypothetical protein
MPMSSKPQASSEPIRLYTYYRSGIALTTPSLNLAIDRNDGHEQVTYIEYSINES